MKKILLSTALLIICSAFYLIVDGRNNNFQYRRTTRPPTYGGRVFLQGEDTLRLSGDTVSHDSANKYFLYKDSCIAISTGPVASLTQEDTLAGKLYSGDIDFLYYSAKSLMNSAGPIGPTRFITALQITFGLRNNKVVLYYKPLCLYRNPTSPGSPTDSATYSVPPMASSNAYFTYIGGNFAVANPLNFAADTLNYRISIRIRHNITNANYGTFYMTSNDTGDVRSVIFPFQEIYAVYNSNNPSGGSYIRILNIGKRYAGNLIKNDIILSPSNLPPNSGSYTLLNAVGFHNGYADAGNVCPPDCAEVKYPLN